MQQEEDGEKENFHRFLSYINHVCRLIQLSRADLTK